MFGLSGLNSETSDPRTAGQSMRFTNAAVPLPESRVRGLKGLGVPFRASRALVVSDFRASGL